MALEALLQRLGDDPESGGVAYEALRERLLLFFTWKGADEPGALVDETLDRMAAKLSGGEELQSEPARYALAIARFVYLEWVKRAAKTRHAAAELARQPTPDPEHEARLRALDRCLDAMPAADADLLRRYHTHRGQPKIDERRRLAEELHTTLNALRIRAMRLRKALAECVRRRLS